MLVLSRKYDEDLILEVPGVGRIVIKVVQICREKVRLGIEAPAAVIVDRREVFEQKRAERLREGMAER